MAVRYNSVIPVTLIVIGAVNLVLGLLLLQSAGSSGPSLFLGPLFAVLGFMQLSRTYFEYEPRTDTITVKALVGPLARRFGGADGGRLVMDGNRIVCVRADGRTKKVPVNRFYARGDQWEAVVTRIGERAAARSS